MHYVNRHAFGSGKEYHEWLWADSLRKYDLNIRLECINNNFRIESNPGGKPPASTSTHWRAKT